MKKRTIPIIAMLVFTTLTITLTTTPASTLDTIDQQQTQTSQLQWLDGEDWQQFKHGGGILTKVDVHIGQYYAGSTPITLSIEAMVGTIPMTYATLTVLDLPDNRQDWVTFDIIDVELNPGQKYYIVLRFTPGSEYAWSGAAMDPYPDGISSVGPNWDYAFKTYTTTANSPPNQPDQPTGQTEGNTGNAYLYQTKTTDPDGDQVWYQWSWGDTTSAWDGPYPSGTTVSMSHTYTTQGSYDIKVKAKDASDDQSPWSDPLPVSMPKYRPWTNPLIHFLNHHPYLFPILFRWIQTHR